MPIYYYQARDAQRQLVTGELQAENAVQALGRLESAGLVVESIGSSAPHVAAPSADRLAAHPGTVPTISPVGESPFGISHVQATLRSHMRMVLARSQVLIPALRAFARELPGDRSRRELGDVVRILERNDGDEATKALARLPDYWIPLLSAATTAQDPGRVLRDFLEESRRAATLRQQAWRSLAYPISIVGMAAVVFTLFSFMVIPTFRQIFLEFGIHLPPLTAGLFELASWVTSGRILIALVLFAGLVWLIVKATRWLPTPLGTWFGDRYGTPLGRATALARLTQFTADLLEAGLELPAALQIAGHTTRNSRLQRASWRMACEIERNAGSAPSAPGDPLTQTVVHSLRCSISNAARIRLLREVSVCHAKRAQAWLSWTHGFLEPLAICVIGVVVGATALALFLPLISLVNALS